MPTTRSTQTVSISSRVSAKQPPLPYLATCPWRARLRSWLSALALRVLATFAWLIRSVLSAPPRNLRRPHQERPPPRPSEHERHFCSAQPRSRRRARPVRSHCMARPTSRPKMRAPTLSKTEARWWPSTAHPDPMRRSRTAERTRQVTRRQMHRHPMSDRCLRMARPVPTNSRAVKGAPSRPRVRA